MSQPSELPESVRDPLAALLAGFKKEAKPYLLSYGVGGHSKEVLWYTLPASGYAPYVAPGNPPSSTPNTPYSSPTTNNFAGDNPPANVGTFPFHPNITRHWLGGDTRYVVSIPGNVTKLGNGLPDLNQKVATAFPGLVASPPNYTWQNWVNDIQSAMGMFVQVPSAEIGVKFDGAPYAAGNYNRSTGAAMPTGVLSTGTFIWSVFDSTPGPTGNGINEIILTDQNLLGGIGFASMLVDPSNGQIIECDIIFNVGQTTANVDQGLFQLSPAGGSTAPAEWTALPHEIGHFWGLDHTNLHPGAGLTTPISAVTAGSLSVYPPTAPVPGGPLEIPVTVGGITWLGAGYNLLSQQLPPDDATALSRIYPVLVPDRNRGKYPLINMTATIQGQYRTAAQGTGIFGKNILAVPALTAGTSNATFAQRGVISGTARLDMDALLTAATGLYVDTRPGMNNAPYYAGPSVMGQQNGTGDFSLQGLTVGGGFDATTGTPLAYDIIMESSGPLGVSMTNQAEWFNEGTGPNALYFGNSPTTGGNANGVLVHSSTVVATGASGPVLLLAGATITSTSVVAGSVIDLHPSDTADGAITSTAFTTFPNNAGAIPAPAPAVREQAIRPLVSITPRSGRTQATNVTIRSRCDLANLDLTLGSGVRLYVNGVDQTTAILTAYPPTVNPAGTYAEWVIPMNVIVGTTLPSQPVNVIFLSKVQTSQAFDLVDPAVAVIAAWGRNDVVL
ncbi:MAG TPA: hypothetical protein ENK43_16180 [Planctomycetes bacterium]|nr:hypothetical protein [Planctomycetota bacterium]